MYTKNMRGILSLSWKPWALGLVAYALVYTREVPVAYAQSVIETDCSEDLDQPNATYILTTNVTNTCVIAADNIILDGQGLYEIDAGVLYDIYIVHTLTSGATIRNMPTFSFENVYTYASGFDMRIEESHIVDNINWYAGNLSITDSTLDSYVHASHDVSITRSTVGEEVFADGSISITDSTIEGEVDADVGVSITDSDISGQVAGNGITVTGSTFGNKLWSRAGDVYVTNSTIAGAIIAPAFAPRPTLFASIPHGDGYSTGYDSENSISANDGNITVVNSLLDGNLWMSSVTPDGVITVERSTIYGSVLAQNNTAIITDSAIIEGDVIADTLTLTDTPPSLTVTPLEVSLAYGKSFNPFSGIEADDVKDGDLSSAILVVGGAADEPGVHRLDYSVTDSGTQVVWNGVATSSGPSTATTTRIVIRGEKPIQSTNVGAYKANKEKEAAADALPAGINTTIETLKTALAQPVAANDPETLKRLIDLVRQLIVALLELLAAQGKGT